MSTQAKPEGQPEITAAELFAARQRLEQQLAVCNSPPTWFCPPAIYAVKPEPKAEPKPEPEAPDLSTRLALRPGEAAEALGISPRALRNLGRELPVVRRGNVVLYPVAGLEQWLREQSRGDGKIDQIVEDLLKE